MDTPEEEDVFRDIEIYSNQTFLELHSAIQEAFNFDQSQLASFHLSDNDWERGEEITLIDMGGGEKQLMEDTALSDHIRSKNQKLLYIFDFMLMWTFFIEGAGAHRVRSRGRRPVTGGEAAKTACRGGEIVKVFKPQIRHRWYTIDQPLTARRASPLSPPR